jgi:UDP-glucose 4-epimerase
MYKKCLVTGGAGFVGSHFIDDLLEKGHHVTAIDNLSTGTTNNLSQAKQYPQFQFIQADVSDTDVIEPIIKECDEVYHFASMVGVSAVNISASQTIFNNFRAIDTLLNIVRKYRPKFMLASTSEVYGNALSYAANPLGGLCEDNNRVYGPTTVNRWSYAGVKALEEFLTLSLAKEEGIHACIVRLFNVTGVRQSLEQGMVVPRFIHQALNQLPITLYGDGLQKRCFTDVRDVVRSISALMENPATSGEVYNIGGTYPITMRDLAETILRLTGSSSPIVYIPYHEVHKGAFEDVSVRIPNVEKLRKTNGFVPDMPLEDIITSIIASHSFVPVNV